jgi:hypothetical protein
MGTPFRRTTITDNQENVVTLGIVKLTLKSTIVEEITLKSSILEAATMKSTITEDLTLKSTIEAES